MALPGGNEIVTNQVLYNLRHRGIEWDLLPWCRQRTMPTMAYSPTGSGVPAASRKNGAGDAIICDADD